MVMDLLASIVSPKRLMFKVACIFCAVTLTATLTLSAFFYRNTTKIISDNNTAFMEIYGKILSDNIDTYVNDMDRTAKILLGNANIQDILERHNTGDTNSLQLIRDQEQLQYAIWSFTSLQDFSRIILADANGEVIFKDTFAFSHSNQNIFEDAYLGDNRALLDDGEFLLCPPYETGFTLMGNRPVYMLARELKTLSGDRVIAYALVLFDMNAFIARLRESMPTDLSVDAEILDGDGVIALNLDKTKIGSPATTENAAHHYYHHASALTGWSTRLSLPAQHPVNAGNLVFGFLLPLALVVMSGAILIAMFMFSYVLTPINRLVDAMKTVKGGDMTVLLDRKTHSSDLDVLYDGFNRMIAEIGNLTETVVQEKMLLSNAQMAVLRHQINPHFLYNTLQTMEAIGEVHGVPEIQVIATSLGSLLRYNIHSSGTALLSEELTQMDTYLKIEQIRFKSRLHYTIDYSEPARCCIVPRFILQPMAENCIVHGGKSLQRRLEVWVTAQLEGELLVISISNSGTPMEPMRLKEIRHTLLEVARSGCNPPEGESIGVFNTQKRIVNRYGPGFGIEFVYSDERGTCVRLTMPASGPRSNETKEVVSC